MDTAQRSQQFPALTGLRAVAAFAVCVTHAAFWAGDYTPDVWGAAYSRLQGAVPVFFALSGFLLVRPWVTAARSTGARGPDLRRYWAHRAWRVLPAYWTVVTVVYVIYLWRPDGSTHGRGWVGYLRHLTFTQIYGVGYVHTGLSQMWSMCVEIAFYLVLPLLGLAIVRCGPRAWIVPAAMVALSAGWLVLVIETTVFGKTTRTWPPAYAAAFAAGIVVALVIDRVRAAAWVRWARPASLLVAAAAFAVLLTPAAGPLDLRLPTAPQGVTKYLLEALIGGLLVAAFAVGRPGVLGSRPMVWLGSISYEYFLIHVMAMDVVVLNVLHYSLFQGSTWTIVAVTSLVTVPLAWVLSRAVERMRSRVSAR
ncbi:acyltransferase family protein [Tsukamurella spumae]|uniref:acyltransferase family protein n=1 Tax=Tsukamurella spumae TaxID=44753 RepID=UPI0028AC37F2|nr:acyltransferase [Tsukamurella spumae]